MNNLDFEKVIIEFNQNYNNELLPKFNNNMSEIINELKRDKTLNLSQILNKITPINNEFINIVTSSYLRIYHNWLLENFNITPKK